MAQPRKSAPADSWMSPRMKKATSTPTTHAVTEIGSRAGRWFRM
jgi:hypothetical protein